MDETNTEVEEEQPAPEQPQGLGDMSMATFSMDDVIDMSGLEFNYDFGL